MRYLEVSDFTNKANIATVMSDIATFKIPKGMVYAFSTRMNMSLYFVECTDSTATADITLTSAHAQCADLGAAATTEATMKGQIVAGESGAGICTGWTIVLTTGKITWSPAQTGIGTVFYCSTLNLDPTKADASHPGICEIRAEAPTGQDIGIPIFSGDVQEIQENVQNYGGTPLRLDGAVLLPEGFVLAIKINALSTVIAGTELMYHTAGAGVAINTLPQYDARRQRIPYERFALANFPRDFKERILTSMSVS